MSKPKRRRWSASKVALAVLAVLVLYVLSSGPFFWIAEWVPMSDQVMLYWSRLGLIYEPLFWFWDNDVQPYSRWLEAYRPIRAPSQAAVGRK